MSVKGSTSRHCYVMGCPNGDYRLHRWRQAKCSLHVEQSHERCGCKAPFEFHTFPTKRSNPEKRERWLKILNRADEKHLHKYKEPGKDHRVCSVHFVDSCPTAEHPDPELNLGHNIKRKGDMDSERAERYTKRQKQHSVTTTTTSASIPEAADIEENIQSSSKSSPSMITACRFIIFILLSNVRLLKDKNRLLKKENIILKNKIKLLQKNGSSANEKQPTTSSLLRKDTDVLFYTGLNTVSLFKDLHDFVAPFVRRRWKGFKCISTKIRKFTKSPKKFGPQRKLKSEDEFLLTLMWLRLGLLKKDLADRFSISESLCSQVFNSWLTAMSKVFCHLVFWPTKEQVIASKPSRYKHLPDLRAIIDCSEIFIETPKDPRLQAATWSDYKHHNTAKFLIGVAPNSTIIYCSNVFNGRASDKSITTASGFLDLLEPYDMIQADKGFNIQDECTARRVQLHIPPGKRGQSQMSVAANIKTSRIANLRILVEQVIRRLKSFRIIKHTVPITLVPALDKILTVCCALCNLKKPIYKD